MKSSFSTQSCFRHVFAVVAMGGLVLSPLSYASNNLGQFDARSMALGGTGVASANSANAAAHNPALIATPGASKRLSIIPFAIRADVYDQNGFIDTIDDTETAIDQLDELLDSLGGLQLQLVGCNSGPACFRADNMAETAQQANKTIDLITDLNKSSLVANVGTGLAFQFGKTFPIAVVVDGGANLKAGLKFANSDFKELQAYIDTMEDGEISGNEFSDLIAQGYAENSGELNFTRSTDDAREMDSVIELVGAVNYQLGVSFADSFTYMDRDLAIGITPKLVKIEAFKHHQGVEEDDIEVDDIIDDDNIISKTDLNMDVGVAFKPFHTQPLQVGVVVKNLFSRSYSLKKTQTELDLEARALNGDVDAQIDLDKFNFSQELRIEPQVTVGVAYKLPFINLMADLDLNEAQVLARSSQNLSLGAELDLKFIKLQAGYTSVISGDGEDSVSAGFTLGIIDVAAVKSSDQLGAIMQLSFSF